jgi:hydrocephalus-inducing protein
LKLSASGKKNRSMVRKENSLSLGDFTINPSTGVVAPGTSFKINVDFAADNGGTSYEVIAIDIADRDPKDNPEGIPYELLAEACIPGINTTDFQAIFEEQTVVRRLDLSRSTGNIYSEHERIFLFSGVILGQVHCLVSVHEMKFMIF